MDRDDDGDRGNTNTSSAILFYHYRLKKGIQLGFRCEVLNAFSSLFDK